MALLDSGYMLSCADESLIGGVRRLFIINRELLDAENGFTASASNHSYTSYAVSASTTADPGNLWHEFEFTENTLTATFETTLEETGSSFVNMSITGFIPKQEKEKADKLHKAIKSCKMVAIVQNNEGEAFVYGFDEKMKTDAALRAAANGETGADLADRNGYEFRLEGRGWDIPRQFIGSIDTSSPRYTDGIVSFS